MYMLNDRVMRNIQNRHKCIKHMNSFTNARLQRKLRKFAENPISGSRVPRLGSRVSSLTCELGPGSQVVGPTVRVPGFGSRVPPMRWVPGIVSRVPPIVPGLGSHFPDMPFLKAWLPCASIQLTKYFLFTEVKLKLHGFR